MAVGAGVSVICYAAVTFLKPMFGYDDSLDAFGVHGIGGTWGALASGLFCVDLRRCRPRARSRRTRSRS